MENVKTIKNILQPHSQDIIDCANRIHSYAELSSEEYKSAEDLADLLEKKGFTVERGLKESPTAFRATYGTGKLSIGYLSEYDALATLQQDDVPYQCGNGNPGHGCGHNLLGAGSAGAGIIIKDMIDQGLLDAKVVVYGTPAEETLQGKTIMLKNGYFKDIDVCLGWHPLDHNNPGEVKFKAAISFTMTYKGKAAHACNCPENGRSALDAAELTNVGVNYLREHVNRDCYMHYCYINAGDRPNIVPEDAKLWYVVRAYTHKDALDLQKRVENIAKGACMMTDTTVEFEVLGDNHDNKLNFTLANLAYESMKDVGTPKFTDEDKAYAKQVAENIKIDGVVGNLDETIMPTDRTIKKDNGSSDIADVSQVVPTVNINTACYGRYTPNHSWAVTAQSNKPAAHKGMLFASQVLALMGVKIAQDNELYNKIKQEFDAAE